MRRKKAHNCYYNRVSDEHLFLHDQADITASRVAGLVLQGIRGKAQLSAHW